MSGLGQIQNEILELGPSHDLVRRKYLGALASFTGRNTILYYSGWMEKGHLLRQGFDGFGIDDSDKNGFMAAIHGLDRSKGLDLVLHTPGGDVAATESIIDYLRSMFGSDIRVIVPHLAMSGGTMIALASDTIIMGRHSSLGPIDPQIGGIAAHALIEEFNTAREEMSRDPATIPLWAQILSKYRPTVVGECAKAIAWADAIARDSLRTGMFRNESDIEGAINRVLDELASHALTLSHSRHISAQKARDLGLKVDLLEDDGALQDAVLSLHHACVLTLSETPAVKLIENNEEGRFISKIQVS